MIIRRTLSAAAIFIGMCLFQGSAMASTAFPSGTYMLDFSGDAAVWDISGTYDLSTDGIDMLLNLNVDTNGKIRGSGHASLEAEGADLKGNLTATGTVNKSGGITRASLTVKIMGTVYYEGRTYKFGVTENARAVVDTVHHELTGTASVKASVAGKSITEKVDFEEPLDSSIDGSWSVITTLNSDEKGRISGSGTVDISGGKTLLFGVKGTYSTKKGLAALSFKGLDALSKAASLRMTVLASGTALNLQTMTASMLGHKVASKEQQPLLSPSSPESPIIVEVQRESPFLPLLPPTPLVPSPPRPEQPPLPRP